ncbi:MAG: ABC transporter ATP-binding protein [Phycisphaerales bacterium]
MNSSGRSSRAKFDAFRETLRASDQHAAKAKGAEGSVADAPASLGAPRPAGAAKRTRSALTLLRAVVGSLRRHKASAAFALATLTVATLLSLIFPMSTKVVWDYVILDTPGPSGIPAWLGLPRERGPLLWLVGGGMVVLASVQALIHLAGRFQMTRLDKLVSVAMRRRVFDHLARLPLHRVQQLKTGGLSSIVRDDAGQMGEMLFSVVYNPWRAIITLSGGLAALALLDWRMVVGGALFIPVVWITHRTWINRIRPVFTAARKSRTAADAHAAEVFGGIRVVRGFGRRRGETARFTSANALMHRQELLAWWWSRAIEFCWAIFIPTATAIILIYGGYAVIDGRLTVGDLTAFCTYILLLLGPMEVLASSAAGLQNSLAGLDRCLDLLEEPTEFAGAKASAPALALNGTGAPARPALPESTIAATLAAPARIEFANVSFAYPNRQQLVLENISLDVKPGQTIALVGQSGAGKTTLCNLVARFYDPTVGSVRLNGIDLRDIEIDRYRTLLGIVEQDVFLFDGSVRENIAYARRDAGDEAVHASAHAANAHEFISGLEKGYETIIGERGVRLSGGQKQRVAIARALLADPRILILDEATSNLDSESEALIQASLARLMQGRTCFVIAHRLGTIRHADRIVVLDKGRIAEMGTHEELVARAGRYADMLAVQLHQQKDYSGPPMV